MPQNPLNLPTAGSDDFDNNGNDLPETGAATAGSVSLSVDLSDDGSSAAGFSDGVVGDAETGLGVADPAAAIADGLTAFAVAPADPSFQSGGGTSGNALLSSGTSGGDAGGQTQQSGAVPTASGGTAVAADNAPVGQAEGPGGVATNGDPTTLDMPFRGFNYVADINGSYAAADSLSTMIHDTGANAVALTTDYGIDPATNSVYDDSLQTETNADITATAQEAENDGLSVMLRPLIDFTYDASQATLTAPDGTVYLDGEWRAAYDPAPAGASTATFIADGDAFLASYKTMIVAEAQEAQAAGVQIFDIGTEIDQLAGPDFASEWSSIITAVKQVFSGKLTYSAIWDDSDSPWTFINGNLPQGTGDLLPGDGQSVTNAQVSFWSQLDYVGIDEYAALDDSTAPTFIDPTTTAEEQTDLAELVADWENAPSDPFTSQITNGQSLIQFYENLSTELGKPLLFTELGFQSATDAASSPFGSATNVYDPELQTLLYQSFVEAWEAQGNTSLQGVYIWNWEPDPTSDDPNQPGGGSLWSPQTNTGALQVLDAAFAATTNPITALAETNTAGVAGREGTPTLARGTAGTAGTGGLAGDSDSAGGTLSITAILNGTVGSFFTTQYGSLELDADGQYQYSADAGLLASAPDGTPPVDVITYTVGDGLGNTATTTLSITDYRDPIAVNETATIGSGETLNTTGGTSGTGALAGDSDPDGASITANVVPPLGVPDTNPFAGTYGTLTINSDGSYTYVADSPAQLAQDFANNNNQPLIDDFTLQVLGPLGTFGISTLAISVNPTPVPSDFNGDGMSDLLLQYQDTSNASDPGNGDAAIWLMNGTSVTSNQIVAEPGANWDIVGTGDFNDNGKADLVWQYEDTANSADPANGATSIWLMNGTTPTSTQEIAEPGASWHVVGTGDFTGNGDDDLVWQYTDAANSSDPLNGETSIWLMNGTTPTAQTAIAQPGGNWQIVATGDFTGNGNDDLVWQYEDASNASDPLNGETSIWLMNGTTPTSETAIAQPGGNWHVVATGDFTGNGMSDLLWQYEDAANPADPGNGETSVWLMNGTTPTSEQAIAAPGANWHVIGTGDYNGDGEADILWQYENAANPSDSGNGAVSIWLMNGTTPTSVQNVGTPPASWHVI